MTQATPVTLNETSMTRIQILLDRATARGEAKSIENFTEDLIDLACDVQTQRWENGDKSKNRRLFSVSLVELNVVNNAGVVTNPELFAKLAKKYQMV